MKSEKNYIWASDYWSHIVYQEATNAINSGDSYGSKGDENWQIIALAEGWANYRQWNLSRRYLGEWNSLGYDRYGNPYYFDDWDNYIAINYGQMFDRLRNLGCSFQNMEKSLCTYSVVGFRENLIRFYPNLSDQITTTIRDYE